METNEVQKIIGDLEYFNRWRRGENIRQPLAADIGESIDSAVELLRVLLRGATHEDI